MSVSFWRGVLSEGAAMPLHRSLADLTTELGDLLGSTDPEVRWGLARPLFAAWLDAGVYDRLLTRLGEGLLSVLEDGVGAAEDDRVFGRAAAASVLAQIIERDSRHDLLEDRTLRSWGDRIATWWLDEQDLRGHVAGKGHACAVSYGADAIAALGRSPRLHGPALLFLLDVIAARLIEPTDAFWVSGEPDRLAAATMDVLCRNEVGIDDVAAWLSRLADRAQPDPSDPVHPYRVNGNVQAYLRALSLQLAVAPVRPTIAPALSRKLLGRLRGSPSPTVAHL